MLALQTNPTYLTELYKYNDVAFFLITDLLQQQSVSVLDTHGVTNAVNSRILGMQWISN